MTDLIIMVILVLLIGSIVLYLVRTKKRGGTCIGCPCAKQCGGNCGGAKNLKRK